MKGDSPLPVSYYSVITNDIMVGPGEFDATTVGNIIILNNVTIG